MRGTKKKKKNLKFGCAQPISFRLDEIKILFSDKHIYILMRIVIYFSFVIVDGIVMIFE